MTCDIRLPLRPLARVGGVLVITALSAAPVLAQGKKGDFTGAFIVRIGNDTLAAEQYTRTLGTVQGESMVRSPQTAVRRYTATFDRDGRLTRYELTVRKAGAPPDAKPLQHATMTLRGDTAAMEIQADSTWALRVPVRAGTLPFLNLGYGLYETAIMRARRAGQDSVVIPMLSIGAKKADDVTIKRVGRDSLTLESPFGVARVHVDADGRLLGWNSTGSTQQVTVERVQALDVVALAGQYASRPLGQLSPRDTVRAAVGGASLLVDYSRPRKRGRAIFGGVVPWNEVWRTGANEATTFVTDKDLVIGGTPVPSGTYSLFSLPTPTGWKLIISKRTKEWGTEYDASADLARIDMQVSRLAQPVEQFTITIKPAGGGGTMTLAWDRTAASVPIRVKEAQGK
jgi:hypothetical protein